MQQYTNTLQVGVINTVTEYVTGLITILDDLTGGNQMMSAFLIVGIITTSMLVVRTIVKTIMGVTKRQLTTTMTVTSNHQVFYKLILYLQKKKIANKARTISLTSMYTWGDSLTGLGDGVHYLRIHGVFMKVELGSETSGTTVIQTLSLIKLGRSHDVLNDIVTEADKDSQTGEDSTSILKATTDGCNFIKEQPKIPMDAIVLPEETRRKLFDALDKFISDRERYLRLNIPYQFGVLLHGIPGSGKTLLIKVIAAYLNKNIIMAQGVGGLITASNNFSKNDIISLEEVDTIGIGNRKLDNKKEKGADTVTNIADKMDADYDKMVLGQALTTLDGLIDATGRIIVMTTNDIDSLDTALIRPGRIDLIIELGCLTNETFFALLKKFGYYTKHIEGFNIIDGVSGATLQQDLIIDTPVADLVLKYNKT